MLTPEIRAISTLPLLVTRVRADHEDPPVPADDLAFFAHRLDRRSYFHVSSLSALLQQSPRPGSEHVFARRYRAVDRLARARIALRAQRAMLAGARRRAPVEDG